MKNLEKVSLLSLVAAMSATPVMAQSEQAPAAAAADANDAASGQANLGEIVVTAQRKTESLQKAPIAVAVVGGDTIASAGVISPAQLSTLVPALQVSSGNGSYSNFYVRGVGNFTGNALVESAVAFNYDGVYVARPSSTTGFFYDLERVEVLKGPQGTLYGRNATGGAINVLPKRPTSDWGGYANISFGNYDMVSLEGGVNAPLGDGAAVRLSGVYNTRDGFMKDGTDNESSYGGRFQLKLDPMPDLTVVVAADYFHQGGKGAGGTPVALGIKNRYGSFSPEANGLLTGTQHVIGGRSFVAQPNIQFQDNSYWGVNSTIEYQSDDIGTFTLIPAYRSSKLDNVAGNLGFFIRQKEKMEQETIEARYATPEQWPIHLLLGGYYFKEYGGDPTNVVQNQFAAFYKVERYGTESAAAFSRLTYDITPDVHLTGGLRYTWERKKFSGSVLSLNRVCLAGFAQCEGGTVPFSFDFIPPEVTLLPDGSAVPDFTSYGAFPFQVGQFGGRLNIDKSRSFDSVTWRAGADWSFTPRNMLYASYETGFKSGGFYSTRDAGVFEPEKVQAWTVGSKNRFFDDRLQLNLEGFYWKYRDQQVSHLGIDSSGTLIFPTENVGRATIKGVEAEVQVAATETTRLSADLQYLSAKYDSFVYQTPAQGGAPSTGCGVAPNTTGFTVDCSGRRPPQAPKWAINLGLNQVFHLGDGAEIAFDARAHYQSRTLTSLEFLPDQFQKSYWQEDIQLTYRDPTGKFSVTGFVNNLSNETVKGQTFLVTYAATPTTWAVLRPPRTYGLRLGFRY